MPGVTECGTRSARDASPGIPGHRADWNRRVPRSTGGLFHPAADSRPDDYRDFGHTANRRQRRLDSRPTWTSHPGPKREPRSSWTPSRRRHGRFTAPVLHRQRQRLRSRSPPVHRSTSGQHEMTQRSIPRYTGTLPPETPGVPGDKARPTRRVPRYTGGIEAIDAREYPGVPGVSLLTPHGTRIRCPPCTTVAHHAPRVLRYTGGLGHFFA